MSPCGTVVVGVKHNLHGAIAGQPSGSRAMVQHWHLPHLQKLPTAPFGARNGALFLQPQECIGLVMPSGETVHLAWHPQPRACIYACYHYNHYQVGLRLVNAKSDCIVRSWTIPGLAEYICDKSAKSAGNECSENEQSR